MKEHVDQVKGEFLQATDRFRTLFAATPDDRLNWSPSATSRTPIHQMVHAADAISNIHGMLDGRPFGTADTATADREFRDREKEFTTREQAVSLFDKNSAAFVAWLDALTPEKYNAQATMPFGMGEMPVSAAMGFAAMHTNAHLSQLDYIQTIYGDQVWH